MKTAKENKFLKILKAILKCVVSLGIWTYKERNKNKTSDCCKDEVKKCEEESK